MGGNRCCDAERSGSVLWLGPWSGKATVRAGRAGGLAPTASGLERGRACAKGACAVREWDSLVLREWQRLGAGLSHHRA